MDEPKCCGCCAPVRAGLTIYVSIFLALSVLGLYHFAPLPNATFGLTFIMDEVVDDAKKFCESEDACDAVCDGNMEDLASPFRAGTAMAFILQLMMIGMFILSVVGACKRDAKLLKVFIVGLPIVLFLYLIPGLVMSTASKKPIMAWYLLNAKEIFKDNEAECTQKWVDISTEFMTIQTTVNWVAYFIGCGICSHIVYTAYCARKYIVQPALEFKGQALVPMATAVATAVATPAVAVALTGF
jgi:hypothetical protein